MTRITIALLAASSLVLVACGSSDGGDSSSAADGAVDFFIEFGESEGVSLDRACVEDAVSALSDDDAEKLADLDPNGEFEDDTFNDAIDAVGDRVFDECIES